MDLKTLWFLLFGTDRTMGIDISVLLSAALGISAAAVAGTVMRRAKRC